MQLMSVKLYWLLKVKVKAEFLFYFYFFNFIANN